MPEAASLEKAGMEILGIGPLELVLILVIALIVLGPQDMVKAGHTIGRLLRKTIYSPTWLSIQNRIRSLPNQLVRDAGLEDLDELKKPLTWNPLDPKNIISDPKPSPPEPGAAVDNGPIEYPKTFTYDSSTQPEMDAQPESASAPPQPDQVAAEWITPPGSPAANTPGEGGEQ